MKEKRLKAHRMFEAIDGKIEEWEKIDGSKIKP
jgi:hypothetical protein